MYNNDDIPLQILDNYPAHSSASFVLVINTSLRVKLKQIASPLTISKNIPTNILTNISTNISNQLHHSDLPESFHSLTTQESIQNSKTETNFGEKNSPASVNSLNSILNSKSNFVVCTCGQIFSESKSDSPQRNLLFGKCIWRSNKMIKS